MRIFLSWSGEPSKKTAADLKNWLPNLLLDADIWMSAHSLAAGSPWSTELHQRLRDSDFGILCVTRENQTAPWLIYECGCLIMTVKPGRLAPLLIDLPKSDLQYPLAQFQAATLDREGVLGLVESLNAASATPLSDERIRKVFEKWWPDFQAEFAKECEEVSEDGLAIISVTNSDQSDAARVGKLKLELMSAVHRHSQGIILDLSRVEYASSLFMSVLVSAHMATSRSGKALAFAGVRANILEALQIMRLTQIFRCYPSVAEARSALTKPPQEN